MNQQPSTLQPRIFVSWILVFVSVLETLGLITTPPKRSSGSSGSSSSCSSSSRIGTSGFGLPMPFPRPARRRGGG